MKRAVSFAVLALIACTAGCSSGAPSGGATCTVGAPCTPTTNVCRTGASTCATDPTTPACSETGNVPNGTSCGGGNVCQDGVCIGRPVVDSFAATPTSIASGQSASLSWSVSGAESVHIDQGIGDVPAAGTATVIPGMTTTYTLTASNAAGPTRASATVTVSGTVDACAGVVCPAGEHCDATGGTCVGVAMVSTDGSTVTALRTDATVWAWGAGPIGDGTTNDYLAPKQILSGFKSISSGGKHAIRNDGTLWGWGANHAGEVGDGTTVDRLTPAQIGSDTGWLAVAGSASSSTLAVRYIPPGQWNTLYSWGANFYGEFGDGTTGGRSTPTISAVPRVYLSSLPSTLAAGDGHVVALGGDTAAGLIFAWGRNDSGQVGNGSTSHQESTPVTVTCAACPGFLRAAREVAAGHHHSATIAYYYLDHIYRLFTWGDNTSGQLGDGTTTNRSIPTLVGTGFVHVAAGAYHTVAIKDDGTLWGWGRNDRGQVGDGTTAIRLSPVQIGADRDWALVAAGGDVSLAIKADGSLWAWGANGSGAVGDGSISDRHVPTRVDVR